MTILDDIIDESTDSAVPLADLLGKVQVAATRLGAPDVVAWVRQELGGYAGIDAIPAYRVIKTNVEGTFQSDYFQPRRLQLTTHPTEMDGWWIVNLVQPLMEIQSLSESEHDASREWPASAVNQYRDSGLYASESWVLASARNLITPQSLRGILDVIRSKALDFALELQIAYPTAGSVGGPTVSNEPGLASVVYNITNNITGDGTNVAAGLKINQRSRVQRGDAAALKREVEALGLSAEDAEQFVAALTEEGGVEKPKVKRFLEKVRAGSIVVAGGIATDLVAGSLIELGKAFLGL